MPADIEERRAQESSNEQSTEWKTLALYVLYSGLFAGFTMLVGCEVIFWATASRDALERGFPSDAGAPPYKFAAEDTPDEPVDVAGSDVGDEPVDIAEPDPVEPDTSYSCEGADASAATAGDALNFPYGYLRKPNNGIGDPRVAFGQLCLSIFQSGRGGAATILELMRSFMRHRSLQALTVCITALVVGGLWAMVSYLPAASMVAMIVVSSILGAAIAGVIGVAGVIRFVGSLSEYQDTTLAGLIMAGFVVAMLVVPLSLLCFVSVFFSLAFGGLTAENYPTLLKVFKCMSPLSGALFAGSLCGLTLARGGIDTYMAMGLYIFGGLLSLYSAASVLSG